MKKILFLSLLTCSIFSMQLNIINHKAQRFHEKLVEYNSSKASRPDRNLTQLDILKSNEPSKQPIQSTSFYAHPSLGDIKLFHDDQGFAVLHNSNLHAVKPHCTDKIVRKVTPLDMIAFQKVNKGYLHINQNGKGEFEIKVMERRPGGGPLLGKIMYWATKVTCYGILAAATVASVMQGGAIPAPSSGQDLAMNTLKGMGQGALRTVAINNVEGVISNGIGYVASNATIPLAHITGAVGKEVVVTVGKETMARIISTVPSGLPSVAAWGINTVGGGLIGAGLQEEAKALVAVSTVTTSGTGYGITGVIEALSLTVGAFFGLAPTP